MTTIACVDGFLGDCAKGKFTDLLSSKSNDGGAVVRYVGGANAGRRINHSGKEFKLHLFPSGAFCDNMTNVIGPMVAFDPVQFFIEYDNLLSLGYNPKIMISDRVKILFPFHRYINKVEEEHLGKKSFGSTQRGITPFMNDVFGKQALTIQDIYETKEIVKEKLKRCIDMKNCLLNNYYNREEINIDGSIDQVLDLRDRLKPFIGDVRKFLLNLKDKNKTILFEGQLGAIRDITVLYPHISSAPSFFAGYAPISCGLPGTYLEEVLCLFKAYVSYVGSGDFVTRMEKDFEDKFREIANEYGTTSGRGRLLGHYDCVMARYGAEVHGATQIGLTCLDLLSDWDEIPVCIAYEDTRTGNRVDDFPLTNDLKYMKPIYKIMPGWKQDISNCKSFSELPEKCRNYVSFIEDQLCYHIRYISVGKERDAIIDRIGENYLTEEEINNILYKTKDFIVNDNKFSLTH